MWAWLGGIAGLIGGMITVMMTQTGREVIVRALFIVAAVSAVVAAFLSMKTVVVALANVAFDSAWNTLGANSWTVNTMSWLYCVTPPALVDAIVAVMSILVAGALIRFTRWVMTMRVG